MDYDGNKLGNGNSDKGGRQATAMAMKRMMGMVMRVVGNKEGSGIGGKSDSDSDMGSG